MSRKSCPTPELHLPVVAPKQPAENENTLNILATHPTRQRAMTSSELLHALETFVENECIPAEVTIAQEMQAIEEKSGSRWKEIPSTMTKLKDKARSLGLWNLFMPKVKLASTCGATSWRPGRSARYYLCAIRRPKRVLYAAAIRLMGPRVQSSKVVGVVRCLLLSSVVLDR